MVRVIDYGMGNILSVRNALEMVGAEVEVCTDPEEVLEVERIVLPGVGSFGDCITNLKKRGFIEVLNEAVLKMKKPILGICLGMQIMAKKSYEAGEHEGLGWFDAETVRLTLQDSSLRVPHIGWNNINYRKDSFLFKGLPESPDVYFVHSYYMKCNSESDVIAEFEYGGKFTAAVQKENIVATQFHPEKSQDYGLAILQNFIQWQPQNA